MSDLGRLIAGRYRLVERVGRGGMGTVWRAEDELLGRHVAVKKLHVPPHLHDDDIQRLYERTRREARSAARITHSHVIVVHDVVDDEGLPCIVMEYIPSLTLSDVLKRQGTLSPTEAARIGRAMAAALRAAHAVGVLHRDVKPANVLLGHDGRIVLTDFGIAVEPGTPSLTRTGELVGSIHYLAPERLRSGIAEPGPASDLWALGATLYQAVQGTPPFHRDTPIETAYAIATEECPPASDAGHLTSVIEGLLVKDPGQRMDADEAERLLSGAADTTGTALLEPPTEPKTRGDSPEAPAREGRWGRRRALWIVPAVLVAAVAAGGALWLGRGDAARGDGASGRPGTPSASSSSSLPPLPHGYRLEQAAQGISVPVPDGWTFKNMPGGEVAYISGLAGMRINVVQFAGNDPVRHWRDTEEAQTRQDNPGYERVRMDRTTFRGRPAGYWEFTFQGRVRKYRAVELAFSGSDGTQYVIYLSAPNDEWSRYRPVFDNAAKGIRLRG
ncbi:serine/threonine protein phosphatase [Streptomyces yokosukanensis]|uniref:non-specific serine/threonine protein kinase n=1 Tax=Streptomyces yokosukanensis TaxID=67386 RepID=A0A101NUT1_9ACTN|nr:serine/threonine-protein kinase [Streptomyces yokosukanensis]KUM99597.1 serine/threonine protein phosphatase [Streptomyces yokosukanensis]